MKRAEELLKTGRVRGVSSRQSAELLRGGGREDYRMLDVRPAWEWERAHIPDALHVPLFVEDDSTGPLALLRKQIQFGFGGWSLLALDELDRAGYRKLAWFAGGMHTARDDDFPNVEGPTKLRFATAGGVQGQVLKVLQAFDSTGTPPQA
eukprot:SM001592S01745  [mRNA]  locus=s1592:59:1139:+ [translate_table: standard]